MFNDTADAAHSTMASDNGGTRRAASSARSSLMTGIDAINGVVSILRGVNVVNALGLIKLARRRGPLGSLALFGAGIAVGRAVGMLFAPRSGAETRRFLFGGLEQGAKEIEEKAENLAGKAKDTVVKAEHKVEDLAGKAKDTLVSAERKVENKVGERVEMAKDAVKDTVDQAKSLVTPPESYRQGDDIIKANGTGNHRSTHRHA